MHNTTNPVIAEHQQLAILYSLRNCPYAMRARIAIFKAQQTTLLRDVVLSNKPQEMIAVSPKATVPVLVLNDGTVIEESLEVMLWALNETDPDNLLQSVNNSENKNESDYQSDNKNTLAKMLALIHTFDEEFKVCLEQYKCAKRYKENNIVECRKACEVFIQELENRLTSHRFLMSNQESLVDIQGIGQSSHQSEGGGINVVLSVFPLSATEMADNGLMLVADSCDALVVLELADNRRTAA